MTSIYSTAESVAIWLGPEADGSALAIDLLRAVANQADPPGNVSRLISSQVGKPDLAAVVSLFERDYWRRLWVVQEISSARSITVNLRHQAVFRLQAHLTNSTSINSPTLFWRATQRRNHSLIDSNSKICNQVVLMLFSSLCYVLTTA